MDKLNSRAQTEMMSRVITAQVETSLEKEFDLLKEEMQQRVGQLVDSYKRDVMNGMKIEVNNDVMSGNSVMHFQIVIDDSKAREAINRGHL